MGTRSTVKFYKKFGEEEVALASIYQQFDGYLDGVGVELAEFLKQRTLINGIGAQTMDNAANGIGCLAAQFIAKFKTRIGGLYMTNPDDSQEYNYEVRHNEGTGEYEIKVDSFTGTPEEFLAHVTNLENS